PTVTLSLSLSLSLSHCCDHDNFTVLYQSRFLNRTLPHHCLETLSPFPRNKDRTIQVTSPCYTWTPTDHRSGSELTPTTRPVASHPPPHPHPNHQSAAHAG